ncbi:hypothetical protein [Peredibacter starrii]|uniref:Uncharacterized protein n=1 Tax=Peredibacter starrii TaxID=28202 RepID=A0AAX4HR25_9BACT|nr:hypothetical protein [Peredibacter starrii]WPU65696.1 hypothetical protein SOO65_02955 [Peredibacter starrii]
MKFALIIFSTLLSTLAFADLAEMHQQKCETAEVKELMGENGSCRIVAAPKKFTASGTCTGTFMEMFPCKVTYIAEDSISALSITCGDPSNPVMSQEMRANSLGYNIAALIKDSEGKTIIQNDETEYKSIQSNALKVVLDNNTINIALTFQAGDINLTNVSCTK